MIIPTIHNYSTVFYFPIVGSAIPEDNTHTFGDSQCCGLVLGSSCERL